MKLLYLYLVDYGIFKNAEFNFDSEVQFSYSSGVLTQTVAPDIVKLPPDFFKSIESASCVVDSISAIAGANGSGKTSLAKAISDVFAGNENEMHFIAVFSITASRYDIYYNLGNKGRNENEECALRLSEDLKRVSARSFCCKDSQSQRIPLMYHAGFVYISPSYTSQRIIYPQAPSVYDYSVTEEMQNRARKFLNNSPRDKAAIAQTVAYDFSETIAVLETINRLDKDKFLLNSSKKCEPLACLIGVNSTVAERNHHSYVDKKKGAEDQPTPSNEHQTASLQKSYKIIDKAEYTLNVENYPHTIIGKLFYAFAGCYWRDMCGEFDERNPRDDFGIRLLYFCHALAKRNRRRQLSAKEVWLHITGFLCRLERLYAKPPQISQGISNASCRKTVRSVISIFNLLKAIQDANTTQRKSESWHNIMDGFLCASYEDRDSMRCLYDLVEEMSKLNLITHFAVFRIRYPLSSGEMSYMAFWSRLLRHLDEAEKPYRNKPHDKTKAYHELLFLDEAEVNLHPLWQREFVDTTIRFLEKYAPNGHFHIIFATHSPILLSDIPKSNVCLLETVQDNKEGLQVHVTRPKLKNTFGANIYDLYNDPFFLGNGTTGKFAADKISNLLNVVHKHILSSVERKADSYSQLNIVTRQLIGDPFLHSYLSERMPDNGRPKP